MLRCGRRGPALYAVGTALGAVLPALDVAVFALLILLYWLPATTGLLCRPSRAG
jgi:hypothetical protein